MPSFFYGKIYCCKWFINCITLDVNPDAISIAQETVDELAQEARNPLVDALY